MLLTVDGYATELDTVPEAPAELQGGDGSRQGMPFQVAMQLLGWKPDEGDEWLDNDDDADVTIDGSALAADAADVGDQDRLPFLPDVPEFLSPSSDDQEADAEAATAPGEMVPAAPTASNAPMPFQALVALLAAGLGARRKELNRRSRFGGA
eukprot:TRINITY_DN81140_c0_g1_i1.p1 TRINITY_DN81140_c0_g1~~TRINITY_DN81140_c0_g1_i1.p1  ORF type:complete len:162 (+),score=44.94 TRINITY_DN81140_c0_g1_i1:32-487(+)